MYLRVSVLSVIVLLGVLKGFILQGVPYDSVNSIVLCVSPCGSPLLLGVLNGFLTTGCSIRFDDLYSTFRCT